MSVNVSKDSRGFDDIDKFWNAVDSQIQDSDVSSVEEFEYDTSSTISESSDESEGSVDVDADESKNKSVSVSSDKSLESNLSASLSLHENDDDEDTDAQVISGEDSEEDKSEISASKGVKKLESSLSSTKKKNKEGGKNQKRRQSKVQFEDETSLAGSRRMSAPAVLPTTSAAEKKKKNEKKMEASLEKEKKEELLIDESSPFYVEGRISEIPQDESQTPQDVNDDFVDNDVPFDEESNIEDSSIAKAGKSDISGATTPSISNLTDDSSTVKKTISNKKKSKYEYYDTPAATPGSEQSTPGRYVRGQQLPDESYHSSEVEDEDDEGLTDHGADTTMDQSYVDTSYMQAARAGKVEDLSDTDEEPEEEDAGGPRRSRRVTKGKRVQFWKNERPRYVQGRMVGILQADPTPAKPRRTQQKKKKKKSSAKENKRLFDGSSESSGDEERSRKKSRKTFSSSSLPRDVKYIPRNEVDSISVWDDVITAPTNTNVVHIHEIAQPPTKLPITAIRPEGKNVVGVAAQSFNVPEIPRKMSGWISGFCELPPGGIKDAEGVGECCQVFQVASCQDGSVELGLAHPSEEEWVDSLAQRTVLKARDSFYVPPGNIYRLENHSKVEPCVIYWTIIRPLEEGEEENVQGGE